MEAHVSRRRMSGATYAGMVIVLVQFAVSLFMLRSVLVLRALPPIMLAEIAAILMLLELLTIFGVRLGRTRRILRIAVCIIGIMLIALFTAFSVYAMKSDEFIEEVSGESEELYGVSVVVREDSAYTSITDLSDAKLAYIDDPSDEFVADGIRQIKSVLGPIRAEHYDNAADLADALYDRTADAIVIQESWRSQLEETHETFGTDTRTVWNYNIPVVVKSTNTDKDITKESFNVFLCGSDSRNSVDEVACNDVNMVVTVNPTTRQILLTSIPRDYYVELASYNGSDKLTHVGVYGTEEAMKTVEKFTGLKMDFYVKVSFAALVYVVDAMGGIDVESDRAFTAWTNPDVHIEEGLNHMDGVTALAYARERYAYEDGDIHRAHNQAQVIREAAWRAMSPGILAHYDALLDALAMGMKTNINDDQIRSFIKMQLDTKAQWDIQDYQMNGTGAMSDKCFSMPGRELYIMIPDQATVDQGLNKIEECMNGETNAL